MDPKVTRPSGAPAENSPEQKLRHLSPAAVEAFRQFQQTGDLNAVDVVVFAILEDHAPKELTKPIAEMPPETQMIEDLGFDSLAITEVVFFTEDLFGISIVNEEIMRVRTVAELRDFVRRKVGERAAA